MEALRVVPYAIFFLLRLILNIQDQMRVMPMIYYNDYRDACGLRIDAAPFGILSNN